MNGTLGYTAERHATDRPGGWRCARGGARPREAFVRIAFTGLAVAALAGGGGCTFMEQADDVMTGGPQKRIESAEQRQQAAMAEQRRLQRARDAVTRQQVAEVESLMAMRKHLEGQEARLARMKAERQIAEEEERTFRRRIASLDGEIQGLELAIRASRATGETQSAEDLEKRLRALRQQAEELEEDIRLLEE